VKFPEKLLSEIYEVRKPAGEVIVGVRVIKGFLKVPDYKVFYDQFSLDRTIPPDGFRGKLF
jgi:hypothetical protein